MLMVRLTSDTIIIPIDLDDSMQRIAGFYAELAARGITPMTAGGDHLVSLPVLRGIAAAAPLGMIHFDAHTDLFINEGSR